jgi:hypothetical protein
LSTNSPVDLQAAKARLVDSIMDIERPLWRVHDAIIKTAQNTAIALNKTPPPADDEKMAAYRAAREAMEMDALHRRHAALKADIARKSEAGKFYNQAKAQADFSYWLPMDFWTLDEAVALSLGKDPREVNMASIARHLEKPKGLFSGPANQPDAFTKAFHDLHLKAKRSRAMISTELLAPHDVAAWAQATLGDAIPKPMVALLPKEAEPAPLMETEAPSVAATPTQDGPKKTLVSRAALLALAHMWPTVKNDLHHANRNGLQEAAKADGRNQWWKEAALDWAERKGRSRDQEAKGTPSSATSSIFRMHK